MAAVPQRNTDHFAVFGRLCMGHLRPTSASVMCERWEWCRVCMCMRSWPLIRSSLQSTGKRAVFDGARVPTWAISRVRTHFCLHRGRALGMLSRVHVRQRPASDRLEAEVDSAARSGRMVFRTGTKGWPTINRTFVSGTVAWLIHSVLQSNRRRLEVRTV